MLLKLFKGTGPGVILLIALTLGLFWISAFIEPGQPSQVAGSSVPMPLYGLLLKLLGNDPFLGVLTSFVLVSAMTFLLVGFNTSVFFINERTFLPALIYVMITAIFTENQVLNPALPGAVFLMISVIRLMDAYRKPGVAYNFFDAGILISTGSLFYADLFWFGLIIFIGMVILRTIDLLEVFVGIAGLITPILIASGIYFVLDQDAAGFISGMFSGLFNKAEVFSFGKLTIIALIITGLIFLVSSGHLFTSLNSKKIKSRKTFNLLLWIFLISLILYFVIPSVSTEMIWIASIPVSYVLTHFFTFTSKKSITGIVFTVWFMIIVAVQVYSFF